MVELISIHIAKTGGRSFFEILRNEYGDHLDPRTSRVDYFPNKDYSDKLAGRIPENIRVIHGHLHYAHIREIHLEHKARVITWLREPVDRVISNYYFMINQVNKVGESHPHYRKRGHTLLEYARDSVPNKMSKCLEGIALDELFFAGLQEYFKDDVIRLAEKLKWEKEVPDIQINVGSDSDAYRIALTPREEITTEMREEIADINRKDIELYRIALLLRKEGMAL